jgi:hypothetical protein
MHGPLLAHDLAGTSWPSWQTGPLHDTGVRAHHDVVARSPVALRYEGCSGVAPGNKEGGGTHRTVRAMTRWHGGEKR